MSVSKNYYVIAGCDLTPYRTSKYDDFKWTPEGEQLTHYQQKGRIQFFNDPMDGRYLYLGYILACGDEYDFPTVKFNMKTFAMQEQYVRDKIKQLVISGILSPEACSMGIKYEIIVFEECT